ncbi:MAG: methyltransferase domain-containing protein [Candidatus Altiarchaeota archaeon]
MDGISSQSKGENSPKGGNLGKSPREVAHASHKKKVDPDEYYELALRDTWGWDTPENFIRTKGKNLRPRLKAAVLLAQLQPGMRILDVGCGRGEVVLECARRGAHAVGLDYSLNLIKLANKVKSLHTSEEQLLMEFIYGNLNKLKLDERFDRIFMLDLVEHLDDTELRRLFQSCRRLLSENGAIVIHTVPNRWVYDIAYTKILRLFMPWLIKNPRSEKEKAIHINEMTIPDLHDLLKRYNFDCRVWLQDMMVDQAHWHRNKQTTDLRGKIYKILQNPLFYLTYKILAKTALKLLIVNDIFAIAWPENGSQPIKVPQALTERLVVRFSD